MPNITVRPADPNDIPVLLDLIHELAVFERAPNEVINTPEAMLRDGFGPNRIFDAFVAELDGQVIGAAITYFRYSTWKGRCLYLEDLIVKEAYRGLGAGKLLFDRCISFGREERCVRMNWQVLDWNTPAIDFYRAYGASMDEEWLNASLDL